MAGRVRNRRQMTASSTDRCKIVVRDANGDEVLTVLLSEIRGRTWIAVASWRGRRLTWSMGERERRQGGHHRHHAGAVRLYALPPSAYPRRFLIVVVAGHAGLGRHRALRRGQWHQLRWEASPRLPSLILAPLATKPASRASRPIGRIIFLCGGWIACCSHAPSSSGAPSGPSPLAHRSSNLLRRQCRILRHCRLYRAVRDAVACCAVASEMGQSGRHKSNRPATARAD
jgi:hypothetical protein